MVTKERKIICIYAERVHRLVILLQRETEKRVINNKNGEIMSFTDLMIENGFDDAQEFMDYLEAEASDYYDDYGDYGDYEHYSEDY